MDEDILSNIIEKIRLIDKLKQNVRIKQINDIETSHDSTKSDKKDDNIILTRDEIRMIIDGYKTYPLYLIKYIFTVFPKTSSSEALDHIVRSTERQCDLMECILTSFSIKLCDIPDINFDCSILKVYNKIYDTLGTSNHNKNYNENISQLREKVDNDEIDKDEDIKDDKEADKSKKDEIISKHTKKVKRRCKCYDKRHWIYLYNYFIDLIAHDDRFMFESYNVNHSITNLIVQTDVADNNLAKILKKSVRNPERWRSILIFIKKTGLVSSPYGDIIFYIRDMLIKSDRLEPEKRKESIVKFNDRVLLVTLLKRHTMYHKNLSMITDNIYITDINGARNTDLLKEKKIDCIVSLTRQSIFTSSSVRYYHITIDDAETVDFLSMTMDVADKVIELITQDKIILVHCFKGVSRSVSFVILVLVKQGMDYEKAFELVTQKRPSANPNPSFRKQLKEYSENIHKNKQI